MPIVRELLTKLGFVTDEAKLKKWDERVASMKTSLRFLAKAAAITGGAITAMAFKTAKAGDEIAKTSRRLGLGVKELQEWRFAADRAGVGAATFDMAFQRFGRRAAEASRGTGEAVKALAELGIELTDVNGKLRDADTLLMESLVALSRQEDEFTRNALAMKLFDSEGVRLVQLAAEGADGIKELRQQFRDLGGGISEDGVKASEEFIDSWTDVKTALVGIVFVLGEELLPLFAGAFKAVTKWVSENRKLAAGIVAATIGIGILVTVIAGATVAVKGLALAWAVLNSQILLIPALILAAIAAIVLLVEDVLAFTKGKDSLFGRQLESAELIFGMIGEIIKTALSAAWSSAKADALRVWREIIDGIAEMWVDFFEERIRPILDAIETIRSIAGGISTATSGIPGVGAATRGVATGALVSPAASLAGVAINMVINSPVGTSAEGVARAAGREFTTRLKELSSGLVGLGR